MLKNKIEKKINYRKVSKIENSNQRNEDQISIKKNKWKEKLQFWIEVENK